MPIARVCYPSLMALLILVAPTAQAISLAKFNNPFASSPVVARMGALELSVKQVNEMLKAQPAELRQKLLANPESMKEWLRSELQRRVLLEETRKVEWEKRPEIEMAMLRAREQAVIDTFIAARAEPEATFPSAKEIDMAYQANLAQFVIPESLHLAQILVRVAENASFEENHAAASLVREISIKMEKGADFGAMAIQFSQDEGSKANRGDLGWVNETELSSQIRNEIKATKTGAVGKPLRTPFGWQILKVVERKPSSVRPLAEVRDAIAAALRTLRSNENRTRLLETIKRDNPQAIDDAVLKTVNGQ